jgi:hypothetical protein
MDPLVITVVPGAEVTRDHTRTSRFAPGDRRRVLPEWNEGASCPLPRSRQDATDAGYDVYADHRTGKAKTVMMSGVHRRRGRHDGRERSVRYR